MKRIKFPCFLFIWQVSMTYAVTNTLLFIGAIYTSYLATTQVWIWSNQIAPLYYHRRMESGLYSNIFNMFMIIFIAEATLSLTRGVRNGPYHINFDCHTRDTTKKFYFNILFHCRTRWCIELFYWNRRAQVFCIMDVLSPIKTCLWCVTSCLVK